ncbi:hypothetical protein Tco_1232149 [Tanacetum coccineum]
MHIWNEGTLILIHQFPKEFIHPLSDNIVDALVQHIITSNRSEINDLFRTLDLWNKSNHCNKVRVNTEESAVKPEPELKNTIECNLNPSDGPGKPNSIIMKTVKTKWALNQFQQPICVQLTKTVKTLKAQS